MNTYLSFTENENQKFQLAQVHAKVFVILSCFWAVLCMKPFQNWTQSSWKYLFENPNLKFTNYSIQAFQTASGRELLRNLVGNVVGKHSALCCKSWCWWFGAAAPRSCVTLESHQGISILWFQRAEVMICSCIPNLNDVFSFLWIFGMKR